jgi:hypothetical protein
MLSMIELHGKKILEEYSLSSKRIIGEIENYDGFSNNLLSNIINTIPHFCLNDVTYYLKRITGEKGFYVDWSVDDSIITNVSRHQPSIYSLVVYESNYGNDFDGGTLEFVDGTIIEPKRGMYVLFDSREVNRVNEVTDGVMDIILITFYK